MQHQLLLTFYRYIQLLPLLRIKQVRQGKYFDIEVNIEDEKKAKTKVEEMCKKLLANLVIEDYKIL